MDSIKPPKKRPAMGAPIQARKVVINRQPQSELEVDNIQIEDRQTPIVAAPEISVPVVDESSGKKKPSRKQRRAMRRAEKPERKGLRRFITWRKVVLVLFLALLCVGGIYAYKVYNASRKIFTGSAKLAPALGDLTKLKGEGDGRVNIALLGIGGGDHAGGNLSDTIMVASLDVKTKDVAIVSVPRDLYVPIPGFGSAKINSANAYGEQYKAKTGGGGALAKKTLENNLGVPIHYYARIDFDGFKKAIDVVGGIDIKNTSTLYDSEYPCDNNQWRSCGYKLVPGQYHMNGLQALKYARCRKGTCGDDYGRAARQQEVLVALRKKALSLGTLSNPAKVSSLIDVIGDDFKTDLSFNEIMKLVGIGKDVDASKIISKVLTNNPNDGTTPLVQNGNIGGASVVIPTAGIGNFALIKAFMRSLFVDNYIKSENAKIEIQNGTSRSGLAAATATLLRSYQYNIINVTSADKTTYTDSVIYDYTNGKKPSTIRYLENRFGVKAIKATPPTTNTTGGAAATITPDIRIIIGINYKPGE